MTPLSVELVERFFLWKVAGAGDLTTHEAKEVDALLTLEKEWRETTNGESS